MLPATSSLQSRLPPCGRGGMVECSPGPAGGMPSTPMNGRSVTSVLFSYRVVDPALPDVDGTGLGLAIVHHIVRAHRGRIAVQSDVGRGAAFHIVLPALP